MPTRDYENEQRDTFAQFKLGLDKLGNESVIIGGDYNEYVNPALDKVDGMGESNGNSRPNFTSYLDVNNLVEVSRVAHLDTKFFTWHKGTKRARLDFVSISEHLLNCKDVSDIVVVCFISDLFILPPTSALSTISRPLSSSMCSITPETANAGSSYNRTRGPGIGCWFSDRSNCSHWSLTLTFTLTSENLSLYTTLLLLLVL